MSVEEQLLAQLDSIKVRVAEVMASHYPEFRKKFMLFDLNEEMRQVGVRLQQVRDGPRIQKAVADLDSSLLFVDMERQFFPPSDLLRYRMKGRAAFKHLPTDKMYSCNAASMEDWQPLVLNEYEELEVKNYNEQKKQYERNKEALLNL